MNAASQNFPSAEEVLQGALADVEDARNLSTGETALVSRVKRLARAVTVGACVKDTFHYEDGYKEIDYRAEPILTGTKRMEKILTEDGTAALSPAIAELATAVEMLRPEPGLASRCYDWLQSPGGVARSVAELDRRISGWLIEAIRNVQFNDPVNEEHWPPRLWVTDHDL